MTAKSFTEAAARTELDVDAIEECCDKATPGPWKVWAMEVLADPVGDSNLDTALPIARTTDPHRGLRTFNAAFIATARYDVPALIAEVRELRSQRDSARDWAAALEAQTAAVEAALHLHDDEPISPPKVEGPWVAPYLDGWDAAIDHVRSLVVAALTGGEDQ